MRIFSRFTTGVGMSLLIVLCSPLLPSRATAGAASTHRFRPVAALSHTFGRVPIGFEVNEGQAPSEVRYVAHLAHATLALSPTRMALMLQRPRVSNPRGQRVSLHEPAASSVRGTAWPHGLTLPSGRPPSTATVDFRPVGASARTRVVGLDRLPGRVNYLIGPSPRRWHTNIPTYARVAYLNIYPHIDLVFHGNGGRIEYDWVLHPGARIASARLTFAGGSTAMEKDGSLVVHTSLGDIRQNRPRIYQRAGSSVLPVRGGYTRSASGAVGFWAAPHDVHRTLVIDPVLEYATYLGGSGSDWAADIAINSRGDAYLVGSTLSPDYPMVHPLPGPGFNSQENAVVSEINAAGDKLLFSTYLGGEGVDDGVGIALDGAGDVYVTGFTRSVTFPAIHALKGSTCNADQSRNGDVFVSELNPDGNSLLFSTCVGGSGTDGPTGIAVGSGGVYVCGSTTSDNFPTKNALQPRRAGGADVFVTRLLHRQLVFSTYLGGSGDDRAGGMAIDAQGNISLAGATASRDFPIRNAVQKGYAGGSDTGEATGDAFVARLSDSGQLLSSTYLGGRNDDEATGIALDGEGGMYVAGLTASPDFPMSASTQGTLGGDVDAFVARLAPDGAKLMYSTFLGGDGRDAATGIAVDAAGNAWVAGTTASLNFPVVSPIQAAAGGDPYEDVFVARLDGAGRTTFATYLGGRGVDISSAIAVDKQGGIYLTGGTSSTDFPITIGLAGTSPDRGNAFIIKLQAGAEESIGDRVAVDGLGLFQAGKNGSEVATQVVRPGHRVLFISVYHTVGVSAAAVHATLRFTMAGRTIVVRAMQPTVSSDRRPMFSMVWRAPRDMDGDVVAHVRLSVGTATATRSLRFKVAARKA